MRLDDLRHLRDAVSMSDVDAVLQVNREFYRSFSEGDSEALEALWATTVPVACIHPGWPVLRGRDQVIASWRSILSGPSSPKIECSDAVAEIVGDSAYVTCIETLDSGRLVATNLFTKENGTWRMLHHQAGAISPAFEAQDEEPNETLH